MSECYLVPGNTLLQINPGEWAAQTFIPRETHVLEYIDLQLMRWAKTYRHLYEIYKTDIAGLPTGDPVSQATSVVFPISGITFLDRYRFKMTPVTLYFPFRYAIVIRVDPKVPIFAIFWQYEAISGNYPRGQRLFSGNNGVTWMSYPADDHIFGEFGNPPLPKPEPEPPIINIAPLDLQIDYYTTSACVSLATSVPCHLTLYYTDQQPGKHHTSRVVRGLTVPWGTYFCFVAWKAIEQIEEGDTLYHHFNLLDWSASQDRWFTIKGQVDNIDSPSVGPIFHHLHPGGPDNPQILRPTAPGDACNIFQQVGEPCPLHYMNVDESPPDEDTTYVYHAAPVTHWAYDLYKINPLPPTIPSNIEKLTVTARVRGLAGMWYAPECYIYIKTHGSIYASAHFRRFGLSWINKSWTWYTNPFTLLPWTQAEINDLQIGIRLRAYWGVGWRTWTACTQLYASVYFPCPFRP